MTIKITKQLATVEDLAIGTGTVIQERNGVPLTLTKIDLITASKLASENVGEGAALVSMQGGPTVEVAVLNRVIRVTSIAAIESYSAPVGHVFSLNSGGRSGVFDVISGDFSTELAADTENGIYIALSDNPTANTKVAKRRFNGAVLITWFGAVLSSTPATRLAIQKAIDYISQSGGGTALVPAGDWKYDDQLFLKDGVHLVGSGGDGERGFNILRYVGSTFQDAIVNTGQSGENTTIENLTLFGGEYQQGRARYVVRFEEFHRFCKLRNVIIRDGFGLLRIQSGYYSKLESVALRYPTPSQTSAGGISDSQWGEVYGGDDGPIYLEEMNGAYIDGMIVSHPVSEAVTGSIPGRAMLIGGEACNVRSIAFESVGTPHTSSSGITYNPDVLIGIVCKGYINFQNFYSEKTKFIEYFVFATEESCVTFTGGGYILDVQADTAFYNNSLLDMRVTDMVVRRADVRRAWYVRTSGLSAGGDVIFDNVTWRSGNNNTDYDTFGQVNVLGAIDGTVIRFQDQYKNFPRKVYGLEVSSGSDGNGGWVDIEGGVFLSGTGNYVNSKMHTSDPSSGVIAPQRLRPVGTSRYWRAWVGRAGNIYLTDEGGTLPDVFLGDWIVWFQTDSGGAVVNVTPNFRLNYRASFIIGTDKAIIDGASATPPGGNSAWKDGDEARNTLAVSGTPTGWRRQAGSWVSMGDYV